MLGGPWKHGNVLRAPVLIGRGLDPPLIEQTASRKLPGRRIHRCGEDDLQIYRSVDQWISRSVVAAAGSPFLLPFALQISALILELVVG